MDHNAPQQKRLVYVAGAYSGNTNANITKAELASITLVRNGWHVITPHKNTSGYEQYEDGDITKNTWIEMDLNLLSRCDLMYVLANWKESEGTKTEMKFAREYNIPMFVETVFPVAGFKMDLVMKKFYYLWGKTDD